MFEDFEASPKPTLCPHFNVADAMQIQSEMAIWCGQSDCAKAWCGKSMCTLDHESQSAVVSACRARYAIAIRLAPPEVLHYVHVRLCQQRSQVKCGRMRQGPMQEHACKEPTDSLAPWWDIIGAFVGEGILHQLEAFLQTMCHAGQSTRSSWNWRKPMRPYGIHMENFHELIVLIEVSGASQTISWTPSNSSRRSYAIYIYLWSSYCIYCMYCNCIHGAD